MELGFKSGMMVPFMKDNEKIIKLRELVDWLNMMVIFIKENGLMIMQMVLENIFNKMDGKNIFFVNLLGIKNLCLKDSQNIFNNIYQTI